MFYLLAWLWFVGCWFVVEGFVGGINSGKSAYEKIIAGASLLQLYTSFVYRGPSIAKDIKKELIQILKTEGLSNIKEAIGKGA